jgi:hypothetical protein
VPALAPAEGGPRGVFDLQLLGEVRGTGPCTRSPRFWRNDDGVVSRRLAGTVEAVQGLLGGRGDTVLSGSFYLAIVGGAWHVWVSMVIRL